MTQVKLLYKRIDGSTPGGVPIADGEVAFWPVRQRNTVGGLLTTVADKVLIGTTVTLDADTYYFQLVGVDDGRGGELSGAEAMTCRVVPPTGGPFEIDDLAIGDPPPEGEIPPDWQLWVADYVATHGAAAGSFPTPAQIVGSTAVGQALIVATDQAAGRAAIGAGTSNLAIGTSGSTAKAGNYQPAAANISDSTSVGRAVLTAADAAAARTATASDYTTVGRSVMTAADAAAARAAIGAGTGGGVSLGTAAGTAAEASEVVPRTGAATKTGVLTTSDEQVIQPATLSTSPLRKDQFDAYHSPCFLFINYSTGVWPSRVIPSGAPIVIWWSAGYPNAVTPPGMIDTDFWAENYPT